MLYFIRSRILANHLLDLNFKLVRIDKDIKDKRYLKYAFQDNKELREAITNYTLRNKK